jgi:quinol monooxygenase YgiN
MAIVYSDFAVPSADRAAFDAWFVDLVRRCREADGEGCLMYRYFVDQEQPERGVLFGVWHSQEALESHRVTPPHIEMVEGWDRWGITDMHVHRWVTSEHVALSSHAGEPQANEEVLSRVRERRSQPADSAQ